MTFEQSQFAQHQVPPVAHQQSLQAQAPAEVFGTTAATSRSASRLSFLVIAMSLPESE